MEGLLYAPRFLMGQWLNYEVRIWLEFNACAAWNKSQFSALTDLK